MAKAGSQSGFTLIESIVSLALVTTVVVGLAAGLLTSVRSSGTARVTQEIDSALSAYAESRKSAYSADIGDCPEPSDFETPLPELPFGATGSVVGSEVWDVPSGSWQPCVTSPTNNDSGVHRLRVEVAIGDSTASAQVVVRR